MCGVFACFLDRPLTEQDIGMCRQGTSMLAHRGPDGDGEWFDINSGVFLGHRRLAIIDLSSSSAQPMSRENFTITYNGELYNFTDVRTELKAKGQHFQTTGDVEVILSAWKTWGPNSLDKFDGMFAFAVWDGQAAHVATDAFGEKPLYLVRTPDGVFISSEIAPLASVLGLKPKLSNDTLLAYMSLGFIPPPATGYAEIERISAAQYIVVSKGAVVQRKTYWSHEIGLPPSGEPEPISESDLDQIRDALVESIQGRLHSDAPLCMFLSRGIDSALVAALATRECGANPQCLTVSYPTSTSVDEAPAARAIAKYLELKHEVIPTSTSLQDITPQSVIDIYGQPCETVSSISIRDMSRTAVDNGYKVALSGMGGDEIFFGYGKSSYFYERRKFYATPQAIRTMAGNVVKPVSSLHAKFQTLACDFGVRDDQRYLARKNFPAIEGLTQLAGFSEYCATSFATKIPLEYWYLNYELNNVLPGLRLVTFDHSSMRASLELRTPFLSRKLLKVTSRFDPRSLIAFGQKSVLRRLLARYVPAELMNYPKSGFVFPQDLYIKQFGNEIPEIDGMPNKAVENIWQNRNLGKGWSRLAIRLINLESFYQQQQTISAD
jgi:asparagine synthase (glutamine-hydrolysing)